MYGAASMSFGLGRREGESRYGDSRVLLFVGLPLCLRGDDMTKRRSLACCGSRAIQVDCRQTLVDAIEVISE